jgi:hypothetical protein
VATLPFKSPSLGKNLSLFLFTNDEDRDIATSYKGQIWEERTGKLRKSLFISLSFSFPVSQMRGKVTWALAFPVLTNK